MYTGNTDRSHGPVSVQEEGARGGAGLQREAGKMTPPLQKAMSFIIWRELGRFLRCRQFHERSDILLFKQEEWNIASTQLEKNKAN